MTGASKGIFSGPVAKATWTVFLLGEGEEGASRGSSGPDGSHGPGPLTCFLNQRLTTKQLSAPWLGLEVWSDAGQGLVGWGLQVLCGFLCCREELAGVWGWPVAWAWPLLPEAREGKYLSGLLGVTFPRGLGLRPTRGGPGRPVLTR